MNKNASLVMSKKLITVRLDDSVRKTYQIMLEKKIRHLPVVDEAGGIIGILSDRDLQRAMTPKTDMSLEFGDTVEFNENFLAKDFMTWPVRTISKDDSVKLIAEKMLKEKVSAYLVTDQNGAAFGIVTTDDLLKVLIKLLQKEPNQVHMPFDSFMTEFGSQFAEQ